MAEKLKQKSEVHPLAILQPVLFSEEMLSKFGWSPTAKIYLKAFRLVKEGCEILQKSNFTNERGISLIAYGYLAENSILQAFPLNNDVKTEVFRLCEITLKKNSRFFEGLVILFAFQGTLRKISIASHKVDHKRIMCLENIIKVTNQAVCLLKIPSSLMTVTLAGFTFCIFFLVASTLLKINLRMPLKLLRIP